MGTARILLKEMDKDEAVAIADKALGEDAAETGHMGCKKPSRTTMIHMPISYSRPRPVQLAEVNAGLLTLGHHDTRRTRRTV